MAIRTIAVASILFVVSTCVLSVLPGCDRAGPVSSQADEASKEAAVGAVMVRRMVAVTRVHLDKFQLDKVRVPERGVACYFFRTWSNGSNRYEDGFAAWINGHVVYWNDPEMPKVWSEHCLSDAPEPTEYVNAVLARIE